MNADRTNADHIKSMSRQEFADAVTQELSAMRAFVALLDQESAALTGGNADTLSGLAAEKTTLLEILSRCAEQRAVLLGAPGPAQTDGLRQRIGKDASVRANWNSLLDAARRAADLNAANSCVVDLKLGQVRRAMDTLGVRGTSLYGMNGISAYESGISRSLAQG